MKNSSIIYQKIDSFAIIFQPNHCFVSSKKIIFANIDTVEITLQYLLILELHSDHVTRNILTSCATAPDSAG